MGVRYRELGVSSRDIYIYIHIYYFLPEVHLRRVMFNIPLGVDTISKYNFPEFQ